MSVSRGRRRLLRQSQARAHKFYIWTSSIVSIIISLVR